MVANNTAYFEDNAEPNDSKGHIDSLSVSSSASSAPSAVKYSYDKNGKTKYAYGYDGIGNRLLYQRGTEL